MKHQAPSATSDMVGKVSTVPDFFDRDEFFIISFRI